MDFQQYADLTYRAFVFSDRQEEITRKKAQIIEGIYTYYNYDPNSVLFVGFNPAILECQAERIYTTKLSAEALAWVHDRMPHVTHVEFDQLQTLAKTVDCVVATEEFFTFARTDQQQRQLVDTICGVARELVITTLRDYKNQDFKDREFSLPAIIRNEQDYQIYFEFNNPDAVDRNFYHRSVYEIGSNNVQTFGQFDCRNMYFKQLAKFSMDAGAKEFLVHKNLMYKSLIKKNYEHVISIKFEQNGRNSKTT